MIEFHEKLIELINEKKPFVSVTLVSTLGSTPQNEGSKMLVNLEGLLYGTIGGGKIEKRGIEEAINLLKTMENKTKFFEWNLNKDIGMTCGGTVKVYFEVYNFNTWEIVIFGAGHISNALIPILLTLDCNIKCIDPREEWLNKLPKSNKLTLIKSENMPDEVANIKEKSFILLITMGHSTDKPILLEILKTRNFPFIGVIGSKAKAKIIYKDIENEGLPNESKNKFYCPVGLDIGTNNINEIAISITAQLLQERDKFIISKM